MITSELNSLKARSLELIVLAYESMARGENFGPGAMTILEVSAWTHDAVCRELQLGKPDSEVKRLADALRSVEATLVTDLQSSEHPHEVIVEALAIVQATLDQGGGA